MGKDYEMFINQKGEFRIKINKKSKLKDKEKEKKKDEMYEHYKLIGESTNISNSKLYLIKSDDFSELDIDWSNRRKAALRVS